MDASWVTSGLNLHLDLVQVNNGCYVGYVMVFTMAGKQSDFTKGVTILFKHGSMKYIIIKFLKSTQIQTMTNNDWHSGREITLNAHMNNTSVNQKKCLAIIPAWVITVKKARSGNFGLKI